MLFENRKYFIFKRSEHSQINCVYEEVTEFASHGHFPGHGASDGYVTPRPGLGDSATDRRHPLSLSATSLNATKRRKENKGAEDKQM
jgi:hypothetical protein